MKVHIDAQTAITGLRNAVKDRGEDYVDTNAAQGYPCQYEEAGVASCIVGHVLMETCGVIGLVNYSGAVSCLFIDLAYSPDGLNAHMPGIEAFTYTEDALRILAAAQTEQDGGRSWGKALKAAEDRALEESITLPEPATV